VSIPQPQDQKVQRALRVDGAERRRLSEAQALVEPEAAIEVQAADGERDREQRGHDDAPVGERVVYEHARGSRR
jgi:hypothetical protein